MGWGHCGHDKQGREIGYSITATCDHQGCERQIDRGLSYACGGMHGDTEYGCEKYFCSDHREKVITDGDQFYNICNQCAQDAIASGEWQEDENEGALVRIFDEE